MAPEGGKRKNKKQYYIANKKAKRQSVLQEGMRGFLLTCNNREKEAVREAYNLLNEYREKLFGSPTEAATQDGASEDSGEDSEGDIEAALEKEKADLNKERSKKPSDRTFQVVDSGAKNCVFIKTTLDCPEKLMEEIISDLEKTKKLKSRFILRMIPILVTCKTAEKNIEAGVAKAIENVFEEGSNETYCINFKTRNNNSVKREDVIQLVTKVVRARPGITKVDLKTPDLTVIVDVIRAVVCVSVVRNFFQRRKYNLAELGKPEEVKKEEVVAASDQKEEGVVAGDKMEKEVVASDKKEEEIVASNGKEEKVVASNGKEENVVVACDKTEEEVVASDKKEEEEVVDSDKKEEDVVASDKKEEGGL